MLALRELKPRIFEITLSSVVDSSDIDRMKRELKPALEADGKMGMILHLEALDDVTGDALIVDARYDFSMLPQWSKVARVAVVTDKQEFEALLNWFDPILPMIDFRIFPSAEKDAAEDWASDLAASDTVEDTGARVLENGSDGLLMCEIDGKTTEEDFDQVFVAFDRAVGRHDKINLMVRVKDYEGFDLRLLGDKDTLTSKFGAIGKIGHYAVVGAPGWMRAMIRTMGPLMPIEICAFDAAEDDAARQWARGA